MAKGRKNRFPIFIITFLLVIIAGGIFFVLLMLRPERKLAGTWTRQQAIEGSSLSAGREWLDSARLGNEVELDGLDTATLKLTMELYKNDSYKMYMDSAAYEKEKARVYNALAGGLKKLLILRAAELGADVSEEQAEAAILKACGISSYEYVMKYAPALLPDASSMSAIYDKQGNYSARKGIMKRDSLEDMSFLVNDEFLILADDNTSETWRRLTQTNDTGEAKDIFGCLKPMRVYAAGNNHNILENLTAVVDGGARHNIKTLHYDYRNNRFVSMRDIAAALNGTGKQFELSVTADSISIISGKAYGAVGGEGDLFPKTQREPDEEDPLYNTGVLKFNTMDYDGNTVKYYTFIGSNTAGYKDAYINLTDLAMMMDLDMSIEDGVLNINTDGHYYLDIAALKDEGFFDEVNSALVGDVTTGEIFVSSMEDMPVPIASTTKLMTYLCIMDAVSAGEISLSDIATVSKKGEILSRSIDGVIKIDEGQEVPVEQLLWGMLLPSSNECALTLAEYVAGSEEAFVERMNTKAALLGISDGTLFINCHGLPEYNDDTATSKRQNHMSARSMFKLVQHILKTYPQIKDITSTRAKYLEALSREARNTNPLLYNLTDCFGLKTGTTIKSGACLVSGLYVTDANGERHEVVAMEFGAEDSTVRVSMSQELLLYGRDCVLNSDSSAASAAADLSTVENLITEALKYL